MNRSKRTIVSRSSRNKNWNDGETFNFKKSPSPKRTHMKRESSGGYKKQVNKVSPQATKNRRKSIYLKRLESDTKDTEKLVLSPRRTRRQSLANLPKAESKTSKTQIPRAKSEKTITRRAGSSLKEMNSGSTVKKLETRSKEKDNIVAKSIKSSSDIKKKVTKSDDERKLPSRSISKNNFYSKSPLNTQQTSVRRKSMVMMDAVKIPPAKQDQKSMTSSIIASKNKKSLKKESPLKQKSPPEMKKKTPHIKKPLKRLSVSTPSPRQDKTRLTRSSAKKMEKKVQIFAKSPSFNADFRKTPRVSMAGMKYAERESSFGLVSKFPIRKLKPFTPKPEEPFKILKETMKKNVAAEMKNLLKSNDVSKLVRPSLSTVRTKSRSSPSKNVSPNKITINGTTPTKNGIHHDGSLSVSYHMPATPLSSRKSTAASFRRYRGAVRLPSNDEVTLDDEDTKNSSMNELLSSTPVKRKERVSFRDEHDDGELMDISEFSTDAEVSKSFNNQSFGFCTNSVEEFRETSFEKSSSSVVEQPKKSYCTLM